jgi:hypothetical protein
MVEDVETVTCMMMYNKQTYTRAVICCKRRLPHFTHLAHRPIGASLPLGNTREALEATCSSTGQTATKCWLSDRYGQAATRVVAWHATGW